MSIKKFEFEFEDESKKNGITIEYEDDNSINDPTMQVSFDYGQSIISANREGFMVMAKIFAKLALGDYRLGFHIHLSNNFDPDGDDVLTISVLN